MNILINNEEVITMKRKINMNLIQAIHNNILFKLPDLKIEKCDFNEQFISVVFRPDKLDRIFNIVINCPERSSSEIELMAMQVEAHGHMPIPLFMIKDDLSKVIFPHLKSLSVTPNGEGPFESTGKDADEAKIYDKLLETCQSLMITALELSDME